MTKFGLDLTIWPWEYGSFDEVVEIAFLAEKLGLDSLWMSDHLMYTTSDKGSLDVFTALAAVAAKTRNITVGTKVICVPFRHPGLVAKMGATLDILSGGRFVLGVGAGWHRSEFEAFGFPFEKRVSRMREAVEIVKMLWTRPVVDYEGQFYRVKGAVSLPKPLQKPHPPVWIGSKGPRMLRITAEIGDGWIISNPSAEEYRHKWDLIKQHAEKLGRSSREIETACYTYASIASSSEKAWEYADKSILPERRRVLGGGLALKDLRDICIIGDPDEWISRIEEYVAAGAEHLIVKMVPLNRDSLRLYSEKVIPHFKEEI
ncbi:MAG: LLM class flavin-dependent oxidoreductase [Candidatus Bathyarchaeota archaeon]|nr:LLM class flavin-dependent oxidoreductase [Candidatus Bathyarchaeota archaeon]